MTDRDYAPKHWLHPEEHETLWFERITDACAFVGAAALGGLAVLGFSMIMLNFG